MQVIVAGYGGLSPGNLEGTFHGSGHGKHRYGVAMNESEWDAYIEKFSKGTVPWSAEECRDAIIWFHKMMNSPKDDWNLNRYRLAMRDPETEDVQELRLQMTHPMNQIGMYFAEKYKGDRTLVSCHTSRFMQILDFLGDHNSDLLRDKMAEKGAEDRYDVDGAVLEALCELPFEKRVVEEGKERWEFDYEHVIQRAKEINAQSDDDVAESSSD